MLEYLTLAKLVPDTLKRRLGARLPLTDEPGDLAFATPKMAPLLPASLLRSDVFLMIRRHKTTIFTDAKESSTVFELKRIVEGILKRPPDEQRLYKDDQLLDDGKTLGECGFTSQTARPQAPATVGLAFRADDAFEALRIEPFSSPPELPDVMKPQDSGSSANEQAVQ
ncbi:elongin-B isoform 2-T2 [Hipposideros larvatus]